MVGATAALPVALPQELTLENVAFEECHDTLRSQQIASAAKNWERESNGKWEARIFSVDQMPDLTLFLPQLSVEALDNVTGEVQASLCSLESMLSLLFWAASSGGAYNHGEYSAYGRLRVWESLAGFISLDTTTSLEARVALARKCAWYQVAPTSDWFCKVIWDIFICCLNPIRHEVVLLAATDTD